MKTVAFMPLNATSYSEMLPISFALAKEYKIIFILDNTFVINKAQELKGHGFSTYCMSLDPDHLFTKILRKVSTLFLRLTSFDKYSFLKRSYIRNMSLRLKKTKEFFDANKSICAVFTYGDRHAGGSELAIIEEANKRAVNVIIPPLAFFSRTPNLLAQRRTDFTCDCPLPWIKENKFLTQQVYDTVTKRTFLYYEAWMTEALSELGLLPITPWSMGTGKSTHVWCDSSVASEFLMADGCPASKISIIGHLSHDDLHSGLKHKLNFDKEKFYIKGRLNIVIALPQLAEHKLLSWEKHWEEVEFLLDSFSKTKQNIFISLHPKMVHPKYLELANCYKVNILKVRLKEALPSFDVYAATFSSTIPWAIGLGIPVLIFDFYGLGYDYYDEFELIISRDRDSFLKSLNSLIISQDKLKEYTIQLGQIASRFGKIDGLVKDRLLAELAKVNFSS